MTRSHGMPPGRGPWVRAVAVLAVVALVASLGYSALVMLGAPTWAVLVVVALVLAVPAVALGGGPFGGSGR